MMSFKKLPLLLCITIFSLLGLTACDVSDSQQTGTLQVKMIDAPGDYDAVWVDVEGVRVHQSQTAETDGQESAEEAEENGWVNVLDEPTRIDLLTLRNGNEITLGSTELDAGTYTQLRLILGNQNEVVIDGESHQLVTPSQQETGTKLNINAAVEEDETYSLLVDFDAARSIVESGNDMFILNPVLRSVNLAETGTISGAVNPADVQTDVHAVAGDDTLSTITDENGAYMIMGAAPDSYELEFQPHSDQYSSTTLTGVEVASGDTTDVETVTLEQSN